jgi:cell division septal protein FtsQ
LLLAAGAGALGALAFGIAQRDLLDHATPFTVREIIIAGNRLVEGSEVLDLLGVRAGEPWWDYSASEIQARVREHPRVSALHVRYEWFHRLHVEVVEREPSLTVLGIRRRSDQRLVSPPPRGRRDRPAVLGRPGTLLLGPSRRCGSSRSRS